MQGPRVGTEEPGAGAIAPRPLSAVVANPVVPDAASASTLQVIGITAARRREEFGAALERRGATVVYAPAIKIAPLADEEGCGGGVRAALRGPVAVGRLRTALGDPRIIQSVVKRGYRLAYEPERAGHRDGS